MSLSTISVRFESIDHIWNFKNDIKLNAFYLNTALLEITFEPPGEEIQWAITKHRGRIPGEETG